MNRIKSEIDFEVKASTRKWEMSPGSTKMKKVASKLMSPRKGITPIKDSEVTFTPKINKKSAKLADS